MQCVLGDANLVSVTPRPEIRVVYRVSLPPAFSLFLARELRPADDTQPQPGPPSTYRASIPAVVSHVALTCSQRQGMARSKRRGGGKLEGEVEGEWVEGNRKVVEGGGATKGGGAKGEWGTMKGKGRRCRRGSGATTKGGEVSPPARSENYMVRVSRAASL